MILDGKKVVEARKAELIKQVEEFKSQGLMPRLAILQPNSDQASLSYLRSRIKLGKELGIEVSSLDFEQSISKETLLKMIELLNINDGFWGIMVDKPLPTYMNADEIDNSIDPSKDIDGCTFLNAGKLSQGKQCLVPSTAQAVVDLLKFYDISLVGKKVTVVGRSKTVGAPVAQLLIQENATVTVCHSKTLNLKDECKNADILIVAMGKKKFITSEYVSEKSVIIDVGIHEDNGKICGDVDVSALQKCASYSPVPGGVGPLTTLELFVNLLKTRMVR